MHRIRFLIAVMSIFAVLGVGSAVAQEGTVDQDGPAVVIEDEPPAIEEDAWTYRFLVPGLLGVSAVAIFIVVLGYGVRVRGRYRVVE